MRKILFLIAFAIPLLAFPQGEPEDIAMVTDEFQDSFYDALREKGIENYDRAVVSLQKCLALEPNNPVVHFELGKNYLLQKDYKRAYESFEKSFKLEPTNMWALVGMYDVCYETRDFATAIGIVQQLVTFKKEYREELVSLYMNTLQFEQALDLINVLNDEVGHSEMRENYKAQILKVAKYQGPEKANLREQIRKNPTDESNYIALIELYSESNQEQEALDVARQLEKNVPGSEWAQVSLFKSHIAKNDGPQAVKAMNVVLASKKIDAKIKHRVMNEFLIFASKNPGHDADLEKAISYFDGDRDVRVAKEIGKFYHAREDWKSAIKYYEMHLADNPQDNETVALLLESAAKAGDFARVAKISSEMLELFPLQPEFYLFAGVASNELGNFAKAREFLENGLDYIVDNDDMTRSFHNALAKAYGGLGDAKKQLEFQKKASK